MEPSRLYPCKHKTTLIQLMTMQIISHMIILYTLTMVHVSYDTFLEKKKKKKSVLLSLIRKYLTFSFLVFKQSTTISFINQTLILSPDTLKVTLRIISWPFVSLQSKLRVWTAITSSGQVRQKRLQQNILIIQKKEAGKFPNKGKIRGRSTMASIYFPQLRNFC